MYTKKIYKYYAYKEIEITSKKRERTNQLIDKYIIRTNTSVMKMNFLQILDIMILGLKLQMNIPRKRSKK